MTLPLLQNFHVLISSIGISWFDINICHIFRSLGFQNVGISLLGGLIVNIDKSSKQIHQHGYHNFCGDIPDINWNCSRFKYDLKMCNRDLPKNICLSDWIAYSKRLFIQMFVWRFFGVISQSQLLQKIERLIKNTTEINGQKWIRWDSRGLSENMDLLDKIPENTNIIVEYYPESGPPFDFFESIVALNSQYQSIKFFISFDPGHFVRLRYFYPEYKNSNPEDWLCDLVHHPRYSQYLRMIEISNIDTDRQNAHSSVYEGEIDFCKIFSILGWFIRQKKVSSPFFLVVEATPMSYVELSKNTVENFQQYFVAMNY